MKLVAVVQLKFDGDWFRLDLCERQVLRRQLFDILHSYQDLEVRWFDADPWTGSGTEFLVCEFSSLSTYWTFWNEVREHTVFCKPYAQFERVSLGYERPLTVGLVET